MLRPRIHVDVCCLSLHQEPCRCPWSRLLPEDMLVLVSHAAAKDLVDMGELCYHLKPLWWYLGPCCQQGLFGCPWFWCSWGLCWYPRFILPQRARFIWMTCASTWDHGDARSMLLLRAMSGPGVLLSWVLCWCPWPLLPLRAMIEVLASAVAKDNIYGNGVCYHQRPRDLCCLQKSCVGPWSMLPLTVKGKEATFAIVLVTTDSQLRKRDMEGQPIPPAYSIPSLKSNIIERKPSKRTLKNHEM